MHVDAPWIALTGCWPDHADPPAAALLLLLLLLLLCGLCCCRVRGSVS